MRRSCSRILIMVMAVVAFVSVLSGDAYAAEPTPAERAELWHEGIDVFITAHPDLTLEQGELLGQGVRLGDEMATLTQDARDQAAFARKAFGFIERAREFFTNDQLGELFTGMGETQVWMVQVTAGEPFCNCPGTTCVMGDGGPTGTCKSGCTTWTDSNGTRQIGICSTATTTQ